MTKETRVDVSSQIKTVEDLRPGDKVVVRYRKGRQIETKVIYTFGGFQNGMIVIEEYDEVMSLTLFNTLVDVYDSVVTTVWRKTPVLPTGVGNIIYATKINSNHFQGSLILRPGGSWQSIYDPTIRFGATNIVEWTTAEIKINN